MLLKSRELLPAPTSLSGKGVYEEEITKIRIAYGNNSAAEQIQFKYSVKNSLTEEHMCMKALSTTGK